jgi:hypothetical protein
VREFGLGKLRRGNLSIKNKGSQLAFSILEGVCRSTQAAGAVAEMAVADELAPV